MVWDWGVLGVPNRPEPRGDDAPPSVARVLVVDDHRTFAELLALALAGEPDLACVGTAHDAASARGAAAALVPDVVLMDVNLGDDDGLALAAELLARQPDLRVVVLTAHADHQVMQRAATIGAAALLPKNGSLPDLLHQLRTASPRGMHVHPALLQSVLTETHDRQHAPVDLTPREHRVLELLAEGLDVQRISKELGISVNTCRGYVKGVLAKLGAHSQLEAVVIAGMRGIVRAPRRP